MTNAIQTILLATFAIALASCQTITVKPDATANTCSCNCCTANAATQREIMNSWAANNGETARKDSLASVLQTLRSEIQLYKLQHGDTIPDLTKNWTPFTETTIYNDTTYGPYFQQAPVNAVNSLSTIMDGAKTTNLASPVGFVYDYNGGKGTGRIYGTDVSGVGIMEY